MKAKEKGSNATQENHREDTNLSQTSTEQSITNRIREEEKHVKRQFQIWAMPYETQELIETASEVYGLPQAMFVIPILTAIAIAIGNKAAFKWKNYINYPQIWGAIVGKSGTNKTLPGTIAFAPIRKREKESYEAYENEKAICKDNGDVKKPVLKHFTTQDATLEGLNSTMRNNNNTMCYNPDELDSFLQSISRYKSSSDAGQYLSMYSNQPVSIHRAGKEPVFIETPILSIYGTIQPEILKKNVAKFNLVDCGFLQRFLFVYPESIIEQPENELSIPEDVITGYFDFINSLLEDNGKMIYELDVTAKSKFIECIDIFKRSRNKAAENEFLRSMYAKLEISFHRLCIIIEYANNKGKTNTISSETISCAFALIAFFVQEGKKITELITSNKIEIFIRETSMSDVCRFLVKEYPDKEKVEIAKFLGMTKQNFNWHCNK